MYIDNDLFKKLVNGSKYFYRLKPSQMNAVEWRKLMKYCIFIMELADEKK